MCVCGEGVLESGVCRYKGVLIWGVKLLTSKDKLKQAPPTVVALGR